MEPENTEEFSLATQVALDITGELFDLFFTNLHNGSSAGKLSKEDLLETIHELVSSAQKGNKNSQKSLKSLQTLAARGYHAAQVGCALVALKSGDIKAATGYMNMLKNNNCENIGEEHDKDVAELALRSESMKELPPAEQAEEKAKLEEDIRMRYDKKPYDEYTTDDIVALHISAENDVPCAQQLMTGYYEYAGDYTAAREMADLYRKNENANPENTYSDGDRDVDKHIDEMEKRENDPNWKDPNPRNAEVFRGEEEEKLLPTEEKETETQMVGNTASQQARSAKEPAQLRGTSSKAQSPAHTQSAKNVPSARMTAARAAAAKRARR